MIERPSDTILAKISSEEYYQPELPIKTWFKWLEDAKWIGFDWETTGLDIYDGRDKPLGFSVAVMLNNDPDNIVAEYFPVDHSIGNNTPKVIWEYILYLVSERTAVCHNAIFDMAATKQYGFVLKKVFCTMRFDHLLNENYKVYSLEEVSRRWVGDSVKRKSPIFEMALLAYGWDMPVNIMRDYALSDAGGTLKTALRQLKAAETRGENLGPYWKKFENPIHEVLSYMREVGVAVDLDKCKEMEAIGLKEQARITNDFGFNPGSPVGLNRLLIETLKYPVVKVSDKTGKPSFDKNAMEIYEPMLERDGSDAGGKLRVYRGWNKSTSSYYAAYQRHVSPDGRLRPEYKTNGTVTGRFSCANPNLQQIPKETNKVWNGSIKECLVSSPGYVGIEIDYSQLEFRLAASFARIPKLIDIFSDPGRDIFNEMSAALGFPRQTCKVTSYLSIYGGGKGKLALTLGITEEQAAQILADFYMEYPELRRYANLVQRDIERNGYAEFWSGRRRHIPERSKAYKGMNSLIQGGGADIVKAVMILAFRELVDDDCRLLLQVHDSLWFEIKEDKVDYYLPQIIQIMNSPQKMLGVPLAVDAHPWSNRESRKLEELQQKGKVLSMLVQA